MSESFPSLGRRVPSLSQLHNLEDLVGQDLASAIDTLTIDAHATEKTALNNRTHDQPVNGCVINPTPSLNTGPVPEAEHGTWQALLKFAQDLESRSLIILNVESVPTENLCPECLAYGSLKYLETEFQQEFGVVFVAYHVSF